MLNKKCNKTPHLALYAINVGMNARVIYTINTEPRSHIHDCNRKVNVVKYWSFLTLSVCVRQAFNGDTNIHA